MNQLFNKFEVSAQGRSVADSVRLLDLLKKLATSNTAKPSVGGLWPCTSSHHALICSRPYTQAIVSWLTALAVLPSSVQVLHYAHLSYVCPCLCRALRVKTSLLSGFWP